MRGIRMVKTIKVVDKKTTVWPILVALSILMLFWVAINSTDQFRTPNDQTFCYGFSMADWTCEPVYDINTFAIFGVLMGLLLGFVILIYTLSEVNIYTIPYLRKKKIR